MSLPTSRNTSYSASSPVKSADLNDMQDCIVGAKHGEVSLAVPLSVDFSSGCTSSITLISSSGVAAIVIPLPVLDGCRIKSASFEYAVTGGTPRNLTLITITEWNGNSGTTYATLADIMAVASGGPFVSATVAPATPAVKAAGRVAALMITASGAGVQIRKVVVTYDRPGP